MKEVLGDIFVGLVAVLVLIYAGYCIIESASGYPHRRPSRPDYHSRAFKDEFSRNRRMALNRDGRRCQRCGRHVPGMHVHHKIMRSRGGTNDLWNLTTLCPDCHHKAHGRRF